MNYLKRVHEIGIGKETREIGARSHRTIRPIPLYNVKRSFSEDEINQFWEEDTSLNPLSERNQTKSKKKKVFH